MFLYADKFVRNMGESVRYRKLGVEFAVTTGEREGSPRVGEAFWKK
jgi:hypothetical protein